MPKSRTFIQGTDLQSLPGERVVTNLGGLYLTNLRVIFLGKGAALPAGELWQVLFAHAVDSLKIAMVKDIDFAAAEEKRMPAWVPLTGLLGALIGLVLLTDSDTMAVGLVILLAGLGLLFLYWRWRSRALVFSTSGTNRFEISLGGLDPKALRGVDAFINEFLRVKHGISADRSPREQDCGTSP